jgi:amidophosphoribosyltransferase
MLKKAGAKEVHVRISAPPVTHSCNLGINTSRGDNLIAKGKTIDEIKEIIGADSLCFLSLRGLLEAAGGEDIYCTGCFEGNYPLEISKRKGERQ